MSTILWCVLGLLGLFGLLLLLVLLWLGRTALAARRLQPTIFEFLSIPDVDTALTYIHQHPELLNDDTDRFFKTLMRRTWAKGDVDMVISVAAHQILLTQYRAQGVEPIHQVTSGEEQASLAMVDAMKSPAQDRVLEIMRQLATEGRANIPWEELDEELVEMLGQAYAILRPFVTEETTITMDVHLKGMRQILQQKTEGILPPPSTPSAIPLLPAQARKPKRKRGRTR